MKTPLYKQYENAQSVGVYTMCNTFALVILDIDERDEIAVTAWVSGERWMCKGTKKHYYNIRRNRIHYSTSGRAYIRKSNNRFYFDEIMKI